MDGPYYKYERYILVMNTSTVHCEIIAKDIQQIKRQRKCVPSHIYYMGFMRIHVYTV